MTLLGASLLLISSCSFVAATPTERIDHSIAGLFSIWWMASENASMHQPGFFFSCGQIGGAGTASWRQCRCDKYPCENCYRWWDALALESLANRGIWLGGPPVARHEAAARTVIAHSPYATTWKGKCPYVDDFAWFLLAYIRVYEWLKDDTFLQAAEELHGWCLSKGSAGAGACGGITWKVGCSPLASARSRAPATSPAQMHDWQACGQKEGACAADGCTKNSVTLFEVLIGSAKLAALVPEKRLYRERAIELWDWCAATVHETWESPQDGFEAVMKR